jgi:hypothetical protein
MQYLEQKSHELEAELTSTKDLLRRSEVGRLSLAAQAKSQHETHEARLLAARKEVEVLRQETMNRGLYLLGFIR